MQTTSSTRHPLIVLKGVLTCESPVSFSLPKTGRYKKDAKGQPTIMTSSGERLYLNAPAIRSAVRHAATTLIHELTGKSYQMDDYFLAALGGIKDAGKEGAEESSEDGDGAEEDQKRKTADREARAQKAYTLKFDFAKAKNPLLMLFGSMDVPGLVECSHAIDIAEQPAEADFMGGVRANDFRRNPAVVDMLTPNALDDFVRRQTEAAMRSNIKKDIADLDKQIKKAAKDGLSDVVTDLKARKSELESQQRDSSAVQLSLPNLGYETIPQGTRLGHEWALKRASDIELALFLQSLALWALDPKIGGHRNHGRGRLSGSWTATRREPGQTQMSPFGELSFDGYDGLKVSGGLARYMDPSILRDAMADLDFSYAALNACR